MSAGLIASGGLVVADDFDEQSTAFGEEEPQATRTGMRARVPAKKLAVIQRRARRGE
jgi:hypothetical protein